MPILNIDESYNVKSSPSSKNTSDKTPVKIMGTSL